MITCYADSSSLAKRYVAETGSEWIRSIVDPSAGNEVYIVRLTAVEIIAALSRRERGRTLLPQDAAQGRADFQADLATDYQIIEATEDLIESAMFLAKKHFLRGYDAVQLAAALQLNRFFNALGLPSVLFLSADKELNAAATAEGLNVENPNDHPAP